MKALDFYTSTPYILCFWCLNLHFVHCVLINKYYICSYFKTFTFSLNIRVVSDLPTTITLEFSEFNYIFTLPVGFIISYIFLLLISINLFQLEKKNPFNISCKAGLMVMNSFRIFSFCCCFSGKLSLLLQCWRTSLPGRVLGWQCFSLRNSNIISHYFLPVKFLLNNKPIVLWEFACA